MLLIKNTVNLPRPATEPTPLACLFALAFVLDDRYSVFRRINFDPSITLRLRVVALRS